MYSQNAEEQIILDYFKDHIGTFIDIGANDGVTLSNTRALAERGWSGVLVEPSPTAFQKLKENYSTWNTKKTVMPHRTYVGIYFYPFALGEKNGECEFHDCGTHLNKGDHGLLSTLNETETYKWRNEKFQKITVKCFRWKTFLNRLSIKTFDFISLDAEGMDLAILKQINLVDTKMVCVEWNGKDKEEFEKICTGFRLVYTSPENLIFAR